MAENDMANRIQDLRKSKNMTLEEVASIVGVGKSTVRKWETGMIANMKRDKIAKLAKALGTTPAYLMGWEEIEQKNDLIAEVVLKMRTDDTFASVVESLDKLDGEKLETINQMLNTLFK